MSDIVIRPVQQSDLPALLDIYNYYVVRTPITFDIEPRTLAQRQEWLDQFSATGRYRCFVAADDDVVVGYASSAKFKEREAYATSIETSVYCAAGKTRKGTGRRLYATLFEALKDENIHRAFGGVTLPNDASVGLHEAMGFRHIGTYSEIGYKFDRYWDVALYLRDMR